MTIVTVFISVATILQKMKIYKSCKLQFTIGFHYVYKSANKLADNQHNVTPLYCAQSKGHRITACNKMWQACGPSLRAYQCLQ